MPMSGGYGGGLRQHGLRGWRGYGRRRVRGGNGVGRRGRGSLTRRPRRGIAVGAGGTSELEELRREVRELRRDKTKQRVEDS